LVFRDDFVDLRRIFGSQEDFRNFRRIFLDLRRIFGSQEDFSWIFGTILVGSIP